MERPHWIPLVLSRSIVVHIYNMLSSLNRSDGDNLLVVIDCRVGSTTMIGIDRGRRGYHPLPLTILQKVECLDNIVRSELRLLYHGSLELLHHCSNRAVLGGDEALAVGDIDRRGWIRAAVADNAFDERLAWEDPFLCG